VFFLGSYTVAHSFQVRRCMEIKIITASATLVLITDAESSDACKYWKNTDHSIFIFRCNFNQMDYYFFNNFLL
jgi:hypothetical protein